jgi:hypothetical protein
LLPDSRRRMLSESGNFGLENPDSGAIKRIDAEFLGLQLQRNDRRCCKAFVVDAVDGALADCH